MSVFALPRRALICGISGQDGAYLAKLLLDKGYQVFGCSRDAAANDFARLKKLGIRDRIVIGSMSLADSHSVFQTINRVRPHEIYNLAGQSSVGISFDHPIETTESIVNGTLNLLEAIRTIDHDIRFCNAGSSECFGNTEGDFAADESTPFRPRSPYAIAKSAAAWQVALYREAYDLFACTGILFNHESPLRSEHFVTKKIVAVACRIAKGSREKLKLGNIDIVRDWGWAPEYVDAMWRTLDHPEPADYIIATGKAISLRDFIDTVFAEAGLNWENHVVLDDGLRRPSEPLVIRGDPGKAHQLLSWQAKCVGSEVARKLFWHEMNQEN